VAASNVFPRMVIPHGGRRSDEVGNKIRSGAFPVSFAHRESGQIFADVLN
jgi:hypothetical protein